MGWSGLKKLPLLVVSAPDRTSDENSALLRTSTGVELGRANYVAESLAS
ncbi:MAG: hypothetical protein NT070_04660 [Cyanobacteria bacterium]|nr:hypothetical protein [Cyanobacteriota bacterium]